MNYKTIGERVRQRREQLGWTQDKLAALIGYKHRSSINMIENGDKRGIPRQKIQKFASVLGVSPEWLMGWDNEPIELPRSEPVLYINIYAAISCGTGSFVDDNVVDVVSMPVSMLPKNKRDFFAQYAKGDSMSGSGINDGDLLIFTREQCQSGDIGCFCIGENLATCKKLRIVGSQIMLIPTNDKYEPILVEPEDFRCVGKLVLKVSKI